MDWALPPGSGFHYRIYIAADSPKADTQIELISDSQVPNIDTHTHSSLENKGWCLIQGFQTRFTDNISWHFSE